MIVKKFQDGSYLEYADGNFDQWCVYMVDPAKQFRSPPRDINYFDFLLKQSGIYGKEKIYRDFVSIYERTNKQVDEGVLNYIDQLSATYDTMSLQFSKIFTILYMGMLAEENKANTKLGKRIKRLGVYKLLIENEGVYSAANFMRGMRWRQIDDMCKERGF